MVLAIFAIAHSLKLDVVAEVVKTEDQRQFIFDGTALTTKCIFSASRYRLSSLRCY